VSVDPYGRTSRRDGVVLNYRTLEMFEITELRAITFGPLELSQGSYTTANPQSGGTHAGGGALDVRVGGLSTAQRETVVKELRRTGFAAWLRTPSQGDWPYHIHAIAIGDKEMSSQAAQQVGWYKQGKNGLANEGPDDGPKVSWTEYRQEIDLSYYGPEKWDDADFNRFFDRAGWGRNIDDLVAGGGTVRDAGTMLGYIHKNVVEAEDAARAADAKGAEILNALTDVEQTLANHGQQLAAINAKLGIPGKAPRQAEEDSG